MVDTHRAVIQAMENISPSQDPETRRQLLEYWIKRNDSMVYIGRPSHCTKEDSASQADAQIYAKTS